MNFISGINNLQLNNPFTPIWENMNDYRDEYIRESLKRNQIKLLRTKRLLTIK